MRALSVVVVLLSSGLLAACNCSGDNPDVNTPPTASATVTPLSGAAPLEVTLSADGSGDPDGTIATYSWDMGDGSTETGLNATHTYTTAGSFTVTLTVTDDDGDTGTDSATVVVSAANVAPTAAVSASPLSGKAPLEVAFDASTSTDDDGTIAAYTWDFGDTGTGTGAAPVHTYTAEGSYTATVTVTDDDGATDTATVGITVAAANVLPEAVASADPLSGKAPLTVSFDGTGSSDGDGTLASYAWDFDDGGADTIQSPSHTYTAQGTYTAALTVTDADGATDTATVEIVVAPPNVTPDAVIDATPVAGKAPLTVTFDGTDCTDADGTVVSWAWEFGDSTSDTGDVATHTYTAEGTYSATLTVTDDDGATATEAVVIEVAAPNVAPVADLSASPLSGKAPLTVDFDATGSTDSDGTITAYDWDFDDASTGTGDTVSHTFTAAGDYDVVLTVTDSDGATHTATVTIAVAPPNVAPTAALFVDPEVGITGEQIQFFDDGSVDDDGTIVSFHWDLGDGTTFDEADASWVYDVRGSYTVTLTVTDDDGATDTAEYTLEMNDNPTGRYVGVNGSDTGDCHDSMAKCRTLAYAAGVATEGDTVYASPGTYPEVVTVDRALRFKGKNLGKPAGVNATGTRRPETIAYGFRAANPLGTFVDFRLQGFTIDPTDDAALTSGSTPLIDLYGGDVRIMDNVFVGADAYVPTCSYTCAEMADFAIQLRAGRVLIDDNRFDNWRRPVDVLQVDGVHPITSAEITDNVFTGVTSRAIAIGQLTGQHTMAGTLVSGNHIDATGRDVNVSTPAGMTVTYGGSLIVDNTFVGLSSGIFLELCKKWSQDDNTISGNTFENNVAGVNIRTVNPVTFGSNDPYGCVNPTQDVEGLDPWVTGGGRVNGLEITDNVFTGHTNYAVRVLQDWAPAAEPLTAGPLDVTCNYYGPSGPGDVSVPGDRVISPIAPQGTLTVAPWRRSPDGPCDGGLD